MNKGCSLTYHGKIWPPPKNPIKSMTYKEKETGTKKEFNLELSAGQEVVDLGTKVVGIDVLYSVRSRNIQVTVKRVKPNTRFYVFMEIRI